MATDQWGNRAERLLLMYFQIQWVQTANLVLYFIVQIALFVFLTVLPIKITFHWLLVSVDNLDTIFDSVVLFMFTAHIYLYLNYKLGKLVRNPQIQKKLLFQNKVVKMKWFNLVTAQFVYDILCFVIAVYELIDTSGSVFARLMLLFYLAKIYKIKLFHDRFQNYIIGTSFYVVYNVFYGLFILIILVSYVGCVFYQIDLALYNDDYKYQNLLWINSSAWNDIIHDTFGVQLLYAIYWSVGTASSAAYGDISASAPPDVVYNILCLYFEGFLFGFYLSRIHSLPATMTQKENQLLQLFEKFQAHNNDIKAQGEVISPQLYFRILCSIEYQHTRKRSLAQIEGILPEDYIVEIKQHIFKDMIALNPMDIWSDQQLKNALCLCISQVSTQVQEQLYEYGSVDQSDLIFLKKGAVTCYLALDHTQQFQCQLQEGTLLNTFGFITNLRLEGLAIKLQAYNIFYVLKRKDFKELLNPYTATYFNSLFQSMISFTSQYINNEPLGLYAKQLELKQSDVLIMDPARTSRYIIKILDRKGASNKERRTWTRRYDLKSRKTIGLSRKTKISVGVQCSEQIVTQVDKVMILDQE